MHEKIADIQNSFWKAYKDFLQSGDAQCYESNINTIIRKYQCGSMCYFCEALKGAWKGIIYQSKNLKGIHASIADIQNSFWKAYRDFQGEKSMRKYDADTDVIFDRYKSDGMMLNFCKGLIVAWCPVINRLKGSL